MKNINDYKGTKTAIHCKTQDEWDKISELLGYEWYIATWDTYSDKSCINTVYQGHSGINFYTKENYTIIHASDFMPTPRTIKQIETELEVLRNELELLKAQTPKKKPIEFVKKLEGIDMFKPFYTPLTFNHVDLIYKDCKGYDILAAWDFDKSKAFIYLGHFNDGIKQLVFMFNSEGSYRE